MLAEQDPLDADDIFILEALVAIEMSKRERGMGSILIDGTDRMTCGPMARLRSKLRRLEHDAGGDSFPMDRPL